MNSESEIDVEKVAESTLFFSLVKINGQDRLNFRVNYLALINLHTDVENTVAAIKDIVATEQKDILERDTLRLLQARNWRFHLVACGVMLAGLSSPELINQLWNVLQRGSWVAPQIAATVSLLDPRFSTRALEMIAEEGFNDQSVIAMAQLLKQSFNTSFTEEQAARIRSAKMKDSVNSGKIAVTWAEKVRSLFAAT
jgi:hypothetical protein